MLKNEFNPEQGKWFSNFEILVDLGFLGIKKNYDGKIKIPDKKSKKSPLTEEQKLKNRSISKIRIKVEHSIGGIKRYQILSNRLRSKDMTRYNHVAGICAGLWNFILTD